jgi:pimeloyl-ACP methyl ester carboxylesterase
MRSNEIYRSKAGQQAIMEYYTALLNRWPVPHTQLIVPTRIGDTFMIASGPETAPVLVLLHGSYSNALAWMGDVPTYCQAFRTLAIDLPGEPGRSTQNRPPWQGPVFAEWLLDILNFLNIGQAALCGISQGGWTAIRFAISYPERVSKLILLTPGGVIPARGSFILHAIFFSMLGKWGADKLNHYVFGNQPIPEEVLTYMNAIMTHFRPRIEAGVIFTDEELKRLTMPTLLIGGVKDVVQPVEKIVTRLEALLPNLQTKLLPEMGHVLHNTAELVLPFF